MRSSDRNVCRAVGVNVATNPEASKVTLPFTATPPGAASVKVAPPAGNGTTSTINSTFPAQSITLIVAPK